MKAFAALYQQLDETTRTTEKVAAMAAYFSATPAADVSWAVALLTGKRPKRPIRASDIRQWTASIAGIPDWLFEESYSVVGDLAETISLLVPATSAQREESLSALMLEILDITKKNDDEKKHWLLDKWQMPDRQQLFVFNKLISGSFRVGASKQLVIKALARAFNVDEKTVAHQLMGQWDPATTNLRELLNKQSGDNHRKPYPFYLAYQLDLPPDELGPASDWIVERKYDGIRGQLICREHEIHVWSRGEELMTDKFVEFNGLEKKLPDGTVLDGEVLPLKGGLILPFSEMQKRIGRKNLSKKMLEEVPLCLICYDLLEYQGEDIRQRPLRERRQLLEQVVMQAGDHRLRLSPLLPCDTWTEVLAERSRSREMDCEGVMLKHADSPYETGRKRGRWWKWKVDPLTADAVLIYAQPGHGRRANLYTDYTFAIRDGDQLLPFAKAYSGLTDKEIVEVDQWIRKHTIDKFGPVRSVKAELVFEIAFEGISASPRHKSGIALRFPRIARWRKDKKVDEINTRQDLLQLIEAR